MKKLIDLLIEVAHLTELTQAEIDSLERGFTSGNYRKNKNSDRVNKIGTLDPKWKDRKAGVDYEPNPELVAIHQKTADHAAKMKDKNVSHRPKKRKDGEIWGFSNWVLFPPKPELFLDNKEKIIEVIKNFLKNTIEQANSEGNYQELDPEDLKKCLSSIKMDSAGNLHFYGPYRISYNRNKMSALQYKVNILSDVNPESYGKVRKAVVLPAHKAETSPKVQKRLAKPEEPNGEE